jgi:hypothetical protein
MTLTLLLAALLSCRGRPEGDEVALVSRALTSQTWLSGSVFRSVNNSWFTTALNKRIWLGDVTGDGMADFVGAADNGDIWMSVATGTSFAPASNVRMASIFSATNGWYDPTWWDRVWLADVTGDLRADLVGVANNGDIWVSEGTSTSFQASHMLVGTSFATPTFFNRDRQHRIFIADVNGDGKADILGVTATGDLRVALATGSGLTASFATDVLFLAGSVFNPTLDWFVATSHPRVFVGDVTGDAKADVVGLDFQGNLWVSESLGTAFRPSNLARSTVFITAEGWFSTATHPRMWLADLNADNKLDLVGIAQGAAGDGDIWAAISTGAGTFASFDERVLLHESVFQTSLGWFSLNRHPRVWVADVTGDRRADVVGVDNGGGIWAAKSVADQPSASAPFPFAQTRNYLLPSTPVQGSSFSDAAGFFDTSRRDRIWVASVTQDIARDIVGISGQSPSDGDILWRMPLPATVTEPPIVTKEMINSNVNQVLQFRFSRTLTPGTVGLTSLSVAQNGQALNPSNVSVLGKLASWTVRFNPTATGDATVTSSLATSIKDRWGQSLDGDGNLTEGGTHTRTRWWRQGLVAGVSRQDLTQYPMPTGLPTKSGFILCPTLGPVTVWDNNPLMARVVVLAGGGFCDGNNPCRSGQQCVSNQCQRCLAGQCQDVNQPLVIVSADLVGVSPDRLGELLLGRFGIPKENLIFSATHAHAAVRNIKLFDAPYFDDRYSTSSSNPYQSWVEDRISDAVAGAMTDMTGVRLAVQSADLAAPDISLNRRLTTREPPREVNVFRLQEPPTGGGRLRAMFVNFALHPVVMDGGDGLNADFPGYLTKKLQMNPCPTPACEALFLQGGAGDINPTSGVATNDLVLVDGHANRLADQARALAAEGFFDTQFMQIAVERQIGAYPNGLSACDLCSTTPDHKSLYPVRWDGMTTAVAVGKPGELPKLRFGTLPGEPFSALQVRLRDSQSAGPKPFLFGYTNGYLGYLPPRNDIQNSQGCAPGPDCNVSAFCSYGVCGCSGPVYFNHFAGVETVGDRMVWGLVDALANRLN